MRCEEIMNENVRCAEPSETVKAAAIRMRDHDIGFLPVCAEGGSVLGVITDRDIAVRLVAEGLWAPTCRVSEIMTPEVVYVRRDDDISTAEERMSRHQKSRIVVVDDGGRLCGVISLADLAAFEESKGASDTLRAVASRDVTG